MNEAIRLSGLGRLTATVKGTRRYGKNIAIVERNGERCRVHPDKVKLTDQVLLNGRELLTPGKVVCILETPNIICNEGLQLAAGFFIDESAVYDVGIAYCEIGTGTTVPAAGDTALTIYHGRKAITSRSRSTHEDTFSTFFTADQSKAAIEEAGMWGGSDAAAGEATGLLFAHWLSSFDNSGGLYDLTFDYVLTIARG